MAIEIVEKANTPIICGAVYKKELHGMTHFCLCMNSRIAPDGKVYGEIQVFSHAVERLEEGSDAMNQYTLVASPIYERIRKAG
jgi:hypothetical protein